VAGSEDRVGEGEPEFSATWTFPERVRPDHLLGTQLAGVSGGGD
jgi:hypothetical protein